MGRAGRLSSASAAKAAASAASGGPTVRLPILAVAAAAWAWTSVAVAGAPSLCVANASEANPLGAVHTSVVVGVVGRGVVCVVTGRALGLASLLGLTCPARQSEEARFPDLVRVDAV